MRRPELRLLKLVDIPRGRLAGAILLAALASGASVALLGTSAWLIMRASFQPPLLWLMVAVTGVRFFGTSRGVFRYAERIVSHDAAFDALGSLRQKVYAKLERLAPIGPMWRKGDLLDRLIADVDALADLVTRVILPIVSTALVLAGAVIAATLILPAAGGVLLLMVVLAALVGPLLVLRGDERDEAALRVVRSRRAALASETVLAASDPGLRVARSAWLDDLDALDAEEERLGARAARRAGIASGLSMLALAGGVIAIVALAAQAAQAGDITHEAAAVAIMLPLGLIELAALIEPAVASLLGVRASARRLVEVLDTPEPARAPGGGRTLPTSPWPIELDDAAITWPDAARPAVRDVTLRLQPGSSLAIVGPSGSGKSTIIAALMGYARLTGGSYRVGGVPASEIDPDELRALFAWCDQQAHLFDTTVAENLRLAKGDATDGEIREALRRARLGDWVDALPRGIDTRVGQFGVLVSGGQRQRIALARALLADRPVLLVDEPTAGLDRDTAQTLLRDLTEVAADRALVLVTHDLEGLQRFDSVLDLSARPHHRAPDAMGSTTLSG
ncbi:thiol reductant ABC exporter subunit CydC [Blastococcus sp. Marseille-P5729]|uniref:thiol reductant ABC exporter subunit CydC n=1 Tax=Blastococcus sp. Marseille-P5729 TaxID=2086582 RepID=UPI00131CB550|nr:thiol reductant ABC exporter subunit CydC [Blastococcus sp. Marseille-P5729]